MLRFLRPTSNNGIEAKSALQKAYAKSSLISRIGTFSAVLTALVLVVTLLLVDFKSSANGMAQPVKQAGVLSEGQQDVDHKFTRNRRKNAQLKKRQPRSSIPDVPRRVEKNQPMQVTNQGIADKVLGIVPPVPKDRANNAKEGLEKIQGKIKKQKKAELGKVLTSDVHMYTGQDIPHYTEDVVSFKKRILHALKSPAGKGMIFVSLASFRDDLCPATLVELFKKAKYPENIIVGLVDQVKLEEGSDDVPCDSMLPEKYRKQVRHVRLTSREGHGPTHARYIASKLLEGEEYYMQIDSHSHFRKHWDTNIIAQLSKLPNPRKNIITHYPPGDDAEFEDINPPWICSTRQHDDAPPGLFVQESDWCYEDNRSEGIAVADDGSLTTCVSPFMGGGFIIGPSRWVVDVPFDKYIPYIFHGEELLIASRLWTSGWDMFTPSKNLIDHKYGGRDKNVYAESSDWHNAGELSTARARHILGTSLPGDELIAFDRSELEFLGMGTERTYEEYLDFAGIKLEGNSTGRCGQRYNWKKKIWEGKIKLMK